MFQRNKKSNAIEQYQDTTGSLSSKNLQRGYWFVQHKLLFRTVLISILLAFCIGTVGFSLYGWGKYALFDFVTDRDQYARQTVEFINYKNLQRSYTATPLKYGNAQIFKNGNDTYNFSTPVSNLNERFIATITYKYTFAGGETPIQTLQLFPGYANVLIALGVPARSTPSRPALVIESVEWKRVDPHLLFDVASFLQKRNSFSVENITYEAASSALGISTAGVTFQIKNDTLFGYWNPVFYTIFKQGNQTVGVTQVIFDTIEKQEVKDVTVRFLSGISSIDSVEIYPVIDIFDSNMYIPR